MTAQRARPDIRSILRLQELADYIVPHSIRAVAELGVANHLADGPLPVEKLAVATGSHAPSLLRVLRALASKGIFTEVEPESFGLTPMAELLCDGYPHSIRGCFPLFPADLHAWARFDHTLRTGEPAFDHVHGVSYYDYLAARPELSARYDAAQQGPNDMELRAALRVYPWTSVDSLVDVGGSNGAFSVGLARRCPALRVTVFDLPHVVTGVAELAAEAGVADRCATVGGDFFADVPAGHSVYLLKRVLYNWSDDDATAILRAVRAAMRPESRLLLFEPLRDPASGFDVGQLTDLLMLAFTGGELRTREQVEDLFDTADLALVRAHPTIVFPILEARPV